MRGPEIKTPKTIDTVRVLAQHPEKRGIFLFVQNTREKKHQPDSLAWTFPGGQIEPSEEANEAAARELFEEAGIKIDPKEFCFLGKRYFLKKDDGLNIVIATFAVQSYTDCVVVDGSEIQDHCWLKLSEAVKTLALTSSCQQLGLRNDF